MRRPKKIRFDAFSLVSCLSSWPDVELDEEDEKLIESIVNSIPIPFTRLPWIGNRIADFIADLIAKFLYCLDVAIEEVGADGHDNGGEAGKA